MTVAMTTKTVYKYRINLGPTTLRLPADAKFLYFAEQHGHLVAWFELDASRIAVVRFFAVFGTGYGVEGTHLGTCMTDGGMYVWHLYEVRT
jgi:hypothetical protein